MALTLKFDMNLYLISQTENSGYDTFDSAVVAAPTPQEATEIHPYGYLWANGEWTYPGGINSPSRGTPVRHDGTWCSPSQVSATLIGAAKEGTSPGVILASFNAG